MFGLQSVSDLSRGSEEYTERTNGIERKQVTLTEDRSQIDYTDSIEISG